MSAEASSITTRGNEGIIVRGLDAVKELSGLCERYVAASEALRDFAKEPNIDKERFDTGRGLVLNWEEARDVLSRRQQAIAVILESKGVRISLEPQRDQVK